MFKIGLHTYLMSVALVAVTSCSGGGRQSASPTTKASLSPSAAARTTIASTTTTANEPQLVANLLSMVNYPELIPVAQDRLRTKKIHYVVTTATSTTDVINLSGYTFNPDAAKAEISFLEGIPMDPRFNKLTIDLAHDGHVYSMQIDPSRNARRVIILVSPTDPTPVWVEQEYLAAPIGDINHINNTIVMFIRSAPTIPWDLFTLDGAPGLDRAIDYLSCLDTVTLTPLDDKGKGLTNGLREVFCVPLSYALGTRQHSGAISEPVAQLTMFYATVPVYVGDNRTYYPSKFNLDLYNAAPSSPVFS